MSLMAKREENQQFPPIEGGTYQAVCYSVIDFGTQHNDYYDKDMRQVCITWEIPELRIQIERNGEKLNLPRAISKTYTLSLGEKSHLYRDLVAWRGREFTQNELIGFDILTVIRANCILQIINTTKGDKTYANIAAVAKIMFNMRKLEPENPIAIFSMADGLEIPQDIPDWQKDIIRKSREYQAVQNAKSNPALKKAQEDYASEPELDNDDIPF